MRLRRRPRSSLRLDRPRSHPRQPSTPLYTLFSPSQIKQFQEAFNLLDADRDGFLTASDLSSAVANVGLPLAASDLLASAGPSGAQGKVSFTAFLTMMGDHLLQFDKGQVLQEAFASFDPTDEGVVSVAELREALAGSGDRMTNDEVRLPTALFPSSRTTH